MQSLAAEASTSTSKASTFTAARAGDLLSNWKLTPATLMAHLDPTWIPARWLQYLSFKIAAAIVRGSCGLLISAPPRHGKSMLSTIATPLWTLENFPNRNVVIATYGGELSTDFSRQVRDIIQNNQNELSVRLRADIQRVQNFLTTEGGGLKAVGLRGAITGRGAHVLIIDDYIKEHKEALSATYLEDLYNWWRTVARTRLEPNAVVIILATRWVAGDLIGRIERHQRLTGRNFFEIISLPAIAVEGEECPLGRKPGEVLFPERYDYGAIMDIKAELGTRWFNAMFQQRPDDTEHAAVDTGWFKRTHRSLFEARLAEYRGLGLHLQWVRSWDLASTQDAGDFTTGVRGVYVKETGEFFIDHVCRGQFSAAKAERKFSECLEMDFELDPNIKVGLEQEPGSSGAYTIRHFKKIAAKTTPGVTVHAQRASTSKLSNAQPFLAAAEDGKVWLVAPDPDVESMTSVEDKWIPHFIEELETFPEGAHDDQVDAATNAYKLATGRIGLKISVGRGLQTKPAATNDQNLRQRGRSAVTFGRGLLPRPIEVGRY